MKKKSLILVLLVSAAMFVFGQGCFFVGPDGGGGGTSSLSGDLRVGWLFNGVAVCPSDVEDVVLELRDSSGAKVFADLISNCTSAGRTIDSLAPGAYTVILKGLDEDDAITWESAPRTIGVDEDAVAEVSISLGPA